MTKKRRHHHHPLASPQPQPKFTIATRDALEAILRADVGLVMSEEAYSDGVGLERVLDAIGGKRGTAIEIIRKLIRKETEAGAPAGSIGTWSFFIRPAKLEMQRVQAA